MNMIIFFLVWLCFLGNSSLYSMTQQTSHIDFKDFCDQITNLIDALQSIPIHLSVVPEGSKDYNDFKHFSGTLASNVALQDSIVKKLADGE